MNKTIIFDLDGTLCDTIADIVNCVNLTRNYFNLPSLPANLIESYVGDGAKSLIKKAIFNTNVSVEDAFPKMIEFYHTHPADFVTVYPQVKTGLAKLKSKGFNLAVVTNKLGNVARQILVVTELALYIDDCIGDNDNFKLKPNPEAINYLLKKYHTSPENAWILGDNHTDMNSATNANIKGAFATWGYGSLKDSFCDIKSTAFTPSLLAISKIVSFSFVI